MELLLQTLLALVCLICLFGGSNLLLKGAGAFLPAAKPTPVLDNLFRFMSGIYFGTGFLMAWVVYNFNETQDLIYCIGIVVVFSGFGRLYSRMQVGRGGRFLDGVMVFEIVLGFVIILLQYLR